MAGPRPHISTSDGSFMTPDNEKNPTNWFQKQSSKSDKWKEGARKEDHNRKAVCMISSPKNYVNDMGEMMFQLYILLWNHNCEQGGTGSHKTKGASCDAICGKEA